MIVIYCFLISAQRYRRYSCGVTFDKMARIRKVPCDQLSSLPRHKERARGDPMRRNFVIRKLHIIGGWVRRGNNKDRYYVEPGTPEPERVKVKKVAELDFV